MIPGKVLLSGIVGSTAYGMAHEGSDIDRLGVYACPTTALHGLNPPIGREAKYRAGKDEMYHEARKFLLLLLDANPTATELLWLDANVLYEVRAPLGDDLIAIRSRLLSAPAIKSSYMDYARDQFKRLVNRGDGTFSADTRLRTAKHARHMWRLVHQGSDLNATGRLTVRLDAAQAQLCREFGEQVAAGDLDIGRRLIGSAEAHFGQYGGTRSALPAEPDTAAAEAWLLKVRREHYDT